MSVKFRQILVLLFIVITQQTYFPYNLYPLSPAFPPTAFEGHYYTCTFRVSGLTNPSFTFDNLPNYFVWSSSGTIEGIPSGIGSFSFGITYQQQSVYASQQLVLRVAPPAEDPALTQNTTAGGQGLPWIKQDVQTYYQTGDSIEINLNQYASNSKFHWAYLNLPRELQGDSSGVITGIFSLEGFYSFCAICSYQEGNSRSYFFTLNVQSENYISMDFRVVPTVPLRNYPRYNITQVFALNDLAIQNVEKAKSQLKAASVLHSKAQEENQIANAHRMQAIQLVEFTSKIFALTFSQRAKRIAILNDLGERRNAALNNVELKKKSFEQASSIINAIQKILDKAFTLLDKIKQILTVLTNQFIKAQNDSIQAAAVEASVQRNIQSANLDVAFAFQALQNSKTNLNGFTNNQTRIQFNISSASTERDAASFQDSVASKNFNGTTTALSKALTNLKAANSTVSQLQQQKQEARQLLGQAQFNLTQAMNRLYLAQAAKAQSDKSILLSSVNATLPPKTQTSIFSGCQVGNYPTISGSASILTSSAYAFSLSSGYTLLFGECSTQAGILAAGDTLKFEGYMRNGYIHGTKLAKY